MLKKLMLVALIFVAGCSKSASEQLAEIELERRATLLIENQKAEEERKEMDAKWDARKKEMDAKWDAEAKEREKASKE